MRPQVGLWGFYTLRQWLESSLSERVLLERGRAVKPWLQGDFGSVDPKEQMDALRDCVQKSAHRAVDLHAFWLGLAQLDPLACLIWRWAQKLSHTRLQLRVP